jgi:hypothetical protein
MRITSPSDTPHYAPPAHPHPGTPPFAPPPFTVTSLDARRYRADCPAATHTYEDALPGQTPAATQAPLAHACRLSFSPPPCDAPPDPANQKSRRMMEPPHPTAAVLLAPASPSAPTAPTPCARPVWLIVVAPHHPPHAATGPDMARTRHARCSSPTSAPSRPSPPYKPTPHPWPSHTALTLRSDPARPLRRLLHVARHRHAHGTTGLLPVDPGATSALSTTQEFPTPDVIMQPAAKPHLMPRTQTPDTSSYLPARTSAHCTGPAHRLAPLHGPTGSVSFCFRPPMGSTLSPDVPRPPGGTRLPPRGGVCSHAPRTDGSRAPTHYAVTPPRPAPDSRRPLRSTARGLSSAAQTMPRDPARRAACTELPDRSANHWVVDPLRRCAGPMNAWPGPCTRRA